MPTLVHRVLKHVYTVSEKKRGVELFEITLSPDDHFWKFFFHCRKQQYIVYKIVKIFLPIS